MATKDIPYLTIAATNKCNFKCLYCSPVGDNGGMGEAYGTSSIDLGIEDLEEKIKIAEKEGISKIRISGGEPLLVPQIIDFLHFVERETSMEYSLSTNGTLIHKYINDLGEMGRLGIRISLDTLDKEKFSKMCGCPISQYDCVIKNIKSLADRKLLSKICTVITNENIGEIRNIIDFCEELGINLKIFDMYATPKTKEQWNKNYTSLTKVKQIVKERSDSINQITYTQSFGIPSLEYRTKNGIYIRIKDSTSGTRYNDELCSKCSEYPCQEGLYTILYSSDRKLIPCRLSPIHFDASTPEQFKENLKHIISIFQSTYFENKFFE